MADYMRDEDEQAELLKEWWQKNGTAAIITVVLAVAALIGWREWQGHQGEQSSEASKQYQVMVEALTAQQVDEAAVNKQAEALKDDFRQCLCGLCLFGPGTPGGTGGRVR